MKPKPVHKYAQPKYPTRVEIAARPALLQRHHPPAWRKWPELTGAAGLFLLADAARLPAADGPPGGNQNPAQTKAVAIVAPIFEHGEGRGADGCMVMTPPVYLSEEAALQVIREEMAAKGVQLGTNQTTLAGVTRMDWKPGVGTTQEPFKADLAAPKQKVVVEFLSAREASWWDLIRDQEEGNLHILSTVRSYDIPKTAAYLAKRVKQKATDRIYFGTFYDPLAGTLDIQRLAREYRDRQSKPPGQRVQSVDPRIESQRLLRLQVQDFIKWLQAQGAI
jgi:hypothetical protein